MLHDKLAALGQRLGGPGNLDRLPQATLAAALTHTDDVLVLSWASPVFEVPDLDTDAGYQVFDEEHDLLYTIDSGLTQLAFGTQPQDTAWFLSRVFGAYCWLTYTTTVGATRVLLVIRG